MVQSFFFLIPQFWFCCWVLRNTYRGQSQKNRALHLMEYTILCVVKKRNDKYKSIYIYVNVCTLAHQTLIFRWLDMRNNKCGIEEVLCHLFACCGRFYRFWYMMIFFCCRLFLFSLSLEFQVCRFPIYNNFAFSALLVYWFSLVFCCCFYLNAAILPLELVFILRTKTLLLGFGDALLQFC